MNKWYLQTWLIALLMAFWFFIIPGVIGIILLITQIRENKRVTKEWEESGMGDLVIIKQEKESLQKQLERKKIEADDGIKQQKETASAELKTITDRMIELKKTIVELELEMEEKQGNLVVLDDEILYQSYGFYEPKYDLETSAKYKERLEQVRSKQKAMVKVKDATDHFEGWTVDGSKQKGRTMNNNNIKLTIRAFNNECDTAISKVKFNNVESLEKRIEKAFDTLNKVNEQNRIQIKFDYLTLKLEELYLAHEYAIKKQEEIEEQRQIKAQMREEKRVREEIERAKRKIEKEETHFKQAIEDLQNKMDAAATDQKRNELETKVKELETKLSAVEKDKEKVFERETMTRAGYVYIISNIGSFGEGVYKIGMTRRLEPMDRVKELGDASVPFTFDVHAMIFSEDAPKLEKSLHESFDDKRLNMANGRKEFFKVELLEIEAVVKKNHDEVIEFTRLAKAEEYRQTLRILKRMSKEYVS